MSRDWTKILIVAMCGFLLCLGMPPAFAFEWESAVKIVVTVVPSVRFDPASGRFRYEYRVSSDRTSQQKVGDFYLDTTIPLEAVEVPQGWIYGRVQHTNSRVWSADLVSMVLPGETRRGFIAMSRGLPGVALTRTRGFIQRIPAIEEIPRDAPPRLDPLEDSVKIKSVGPDILPDGQTPLQLVDRLASLKDQAAKLGWITNQGIVNSLNVKLRQAKVELDRGQTKTAGNLLHAFIHELEAQRGKHLNDNAFFLLKPNAEFILWKLGG